MTGNTKAAPAHLLGQGTGAVRAVFVGAGLVAYMAAMVSLPVLGMLNQRTPPSDPSTPVVWEAQGVGSDATIVMEARGLRSYIVAWEADCLVTMRMSRWDDTDGITATFPMGRARSRTVRLTLLPGGYFFDADARCPWVVRVR